MVGLWKKLSLVASYVCNGAPDMDVRPGKEEGEGEGKAKEREE